MIMHESPGPTQAILVYRALQLIVLRALGYSRLQRRLRAAVECVGDQLD